MSKNNVVNFKINDKVNLAIFPTSKERPDEPAIMIQVRPEPNGRTEDVTLKLSTFKKVVAVVFGKMETVELLFKEETEEEKNEPVF